MSATDTKGTKLPQKGIHFANVPYIENGKWANRIEERNVVVMAISGGYAMVKSPRCMPYVARAKEVKLCG